MKFRFKMKRVYEDPSPDDGWRVLIDRLWPRGLSKNAAHINDWQKDLAPSAALRKWFAHDATRWAEFQKRYQQELRDGEAVAEFLQSIKKHKVITLLFAAKDEVHNNAIVLIDFLQRE